MQYWDSTPQYHHPETFPSASTSDRSRAQMFKHKLSDSEVEAQKHYRAYAQAMDTMRRDLHNVQSNAVESISHMEDSTKWNIHISYDAHTLGQDCRLQLPVEDVHELCNYTAPDVSTVSRTLAEMLESPYGEEKRSHYDAQLRKAASLYSQDLVVKTAMPLFDLLHAGNINVQTAKRELTQTEEPMKLLMQQVEQLENGVRTALDNEDMSVAERNYDQCVTTLEQLSDLHRQRLRAVGGGDSGRLSLGNSLREYSRRATTDLEEFKRNQEELKSQVEVDMNLLNEGERRAADTNSQRMREFDVFRSTSNEVIQRNSRSQDTLFEQMADILSQLQTLGNQRWAELQRRAEATEQEERRKAEYGKFCEVARQHHKQLQEAVGYVSRCLDAMPPLENFLREGISRVAKRVEQADSALNSLCIEEQRKYFACFRRYYLLVGDYMFKKECRMHEVQRLLREKDMQAHIARETLDSRARQHKEEAKLFMTELEQLRRKVEFLREKADAAKEDFQPVDRALRRAGFNFLHPAIELQELNVDRRQKINSYRLQFVELEKADADMEAEDVKKLAEYTQLAKQTGSAPPSIASSPSVVIIDRR